MSVYKNIEPENVLISSFKVHKTFTFTEADSGSGFYAIPIVRGNRVSLYGYDTETAHSKTIEEIVMKLAPETVLILVKASPEAIRKRMLDKPHKYPVVQEKDIETVLQAFESSFQASQISNKISIDTTRFSPDESLVEFAKKIRAFS